MEERREEHYAEPPAVEMEVAIFQIQTCIRPPAQPHSSNPNMEMWSKLPVKKGYAH